MDAKIDITPELDLRRIFAGEGDDSGPETPGDGEGETGIATKTRTKPKRPSQFKVLLLNDDYTPMEFVVMVLKRFFPSAPASSKCFC